MSVGYVTKGDEILRNRVERTVGSNLIVIDRVLLIIEDAIRRTPHGKLDKSQIVTYIADYDALPEGSLLKKDPRSRTLQLSKSGTVASSAASGAESDGMDDLVQKLSKARDLEAAELANAALVSKLAVLFNLPSSDINTNLPLAYYGVDSLVAVELRNWLSSAMKAKVTIFEILQTKSVGEFAGLVAKRKGS